MIVLNKKGDKKNIKNYRPISLLFHMYKLFTWLLQKRMELILDENQPRDMPVSEKVTRQLIIFKQSVS